MLIFKAHVKVKNSLLILGDRQAFVKITLIKTTIHLSMEFTLLLTIPKSVTLVHC